MSFATCRYNIRLHSLMPFDLLVRSFIITKGTRGQCFGKPVVSKCEQEQSNEHVEVSGTTPEKAKKEVEKSVQAFDNNLNRRKRSAYPRKEEKRTSKEQIDVASLLIQADTYTLLFLQGTLLQAHPRPHTKLTDTCSLQTHTESI